MRERRSKRGPVAGLGRVLRGRPRSYPQICLVATGGYLACVAAVWLIGDWPRHGAASFAVLAAPWLGCVAGWSYDLQRRRNGGRVSEAKPPRLPDPR